jgi:ribonuclease P protein component
MRCPTLKSARQFDLVYTQGRKSTSRALVLFYLANGAERRVAFVASRKVGGAVTRNRAKRLLREALRRVGPSLPEAGWFVLVARREIAVLESGEVAEQLGDLLARVASPGAGQ